MPTLQLKTRINAPIGIVFDLSRSIDLHKISAKHTNETAIGGKMTGLIGLGEYVTWRAKHFGLYHTLTSEITAFEYPNSFVDEQKTGVFRQFKHQHIFKETKNDILMLDVFEYTSPYGVLGRLANFIFLNRYLRRFLEKRNKVIKTYAESGKWRQVLPEH